jgi:hypothetical protein
MNRAHKHVLGLLAGVALGSTSMGQVTSGGSAGYSAAFGVSVELFALGLIGGMIGLLFLLVALAGFYGALQETIFVEGLSSSEADFNPKPFVVLGVMLAVVGWFILGTLGDFTLVGNLDVPFVEQAFGG